MGSIDIQLARGIVVVGAGGYGAVVKELAESCGFDVILFLDDDAEKWGKDLEGIPIAGPISEGLGELSVGTAVAVAVGENAVRVKWVEDARRRSLATPALVSPLATVSPSARIEDAVFLHPGSLVWTRAELGFASILSPHAFVAHHTVLGVGCFVSAGARVGASIAVGRESFFGIGSTTSTGVKEIAERTVVGAGAVVIRNTEAGGIYVGSPGRLLRKRGIS